MRLLLVMSTLVGHITAAASALLRSAQHAGALGIRRGEWQRYLKKSCSLGLCYAGFGTTGSVKEAWMAGEAAFLCCAYDVVTDWRHFDPQARHAFEAILRKRAPELELQDLAVGLYEKELFKRLEDDGLDRGVIALRFVLKMMGCENIRESMWGDVDEVGRLLQIADDVLDYEEDISRGETNCLTSVRRNLYLTRFLQKMGGAEVKRLFGDVNSVVVKVIGRASKKAETLLDKNPYAGPSSH
jgi:hypothetical protein